MSDGKRRRYRKFKPDEKQTQRPITLLAKEDRPFQGNSSYSNSTSTSSAHKYAADAEVKPKILLKTKTVTERELKDDELARLTGADAGQAPIRTIIVTRSEATQSPALTTTNEQPSATTTTAALATEQPTGSAAAPPLPPPAQLIEPVPQMTRPATVISSTGFINESARKLMQKANTDFLVVGIIGTQGVGKSTIMNLLANESAECDYRRQVFLDEESIFPTKLKPHKCSARSRTESTHMFITADRLILLDSPPVLCNSYKKDMTTNELDDLRNLVGFLSVCHLLIVVQDDYFNMSLLRLLHLAELMKPAQDNKPPFPGDYLPNVLFVRNRAKRHDFVPGAKAHMDAMLRAFFRDSQLRIFVGQTVTASSERHKKGRGGGLPEAERVVNSFMLPEVTDATQTYHPPLHEIIEQLRLLVFMTPRNEMYSSGTTELTEAIWFELLSKVSQDTQHFFFNTYEEIHRRHLEVGVSASGNSGGGSNNNNAVSSSNNNSKDTDRYENWRE